MAYCINCGKELGDTDRFCRNCGAQQLVKKEKAVYCGNCHMELKEDVLFCPECGYRVSEKEEKTPDIADRDAGEEKERAQKEKEESGQVGKGKNRKGGLIANSGLAIMLLLTVLFFFPLQGYTLTPRNIENIIREGAIIGTAASGAALVMLGGGLDLSAGMVMNATAIGAASLVKGGMPLPVACLLALLPAFGIGLLNGICITKLKVPFFITTFSMSWFLSTLCGTLQNQVMDAQIQYTGTAGFLMVILLVSLATWILLNRTDFGKTICKSGKQLEGQREHCPKDRTIILLYGCSGLTAGIAGILQLLRVQLAWMGNDYQLYVMIAVLLGGIYLSEGKENYPAVLAGSFLLAVWSVGITTRGFRGLRVVEGLFLIAAVLYQRFIITRRRQKGV